MQRTLLLATSNPGKAAEFQRLLGKAVRFLSLDEVNVDMPDETGETFQENAELKATSVATQSGMITVADDSGLAVDALQGKPGVRSARFAGLHASDAENRTMLLAQMESVAPPDRSARFVCALSLASPDGKVCTRLGLLEGTIADRERGTFGFGYDSVFETSDGRTLAELPAATKNAMSHRGKAVDEILPCIERMLSYGDPSIDGSPPDDPS
ncbi:MAG: RdgB/HAM1 family non-canonical purine NTP pyrophosphatase [Chloroflexota bacterium]|nr:RdgB/HAM1 family non-canonical purine NTP pyrophosphatase [Chloroflexota bacterium]